MSFQFSAAPGDQVKFGDRVFVFFLADEVDRITKPIIRANPDRVYCFIYNSESYDENFEKHYPKIEEQLKNFNEKIEIQKEYIDFVNYYQIIQRISELIKREREKNEKTEVILHCGTGSKISAIALSDASRLWGAQAIYVYSKDYNPNREIKHKGEMLMFQPPIFPIKKPKWKLIETIRILDTMILENQRNERYSGTDEDYVMKKALQEELLQRKIFTTSGSNNPRNRRSRNQMALKQKILDPLEEGNYIKLRKHSRSKKVYLTDEGIRIAKIFKNYNPIF